MQKEPLSSSEGYINIPVAGLTGTAVALIPLAVLASSTLFAPLWVGAALAGIVFLPLVLMHRRINHLTSLSTHAEQLQQQNRLDNQALQVRVHDLRKQTISQQEDIQHANSGHGKSLQRARDNTATALIQIVNMRDPITGSHLERLAEYVAVLVEELQEHPRTRDTLSKQVYMHIPKASMLHDIGKVGIPEAILQKPARLTPEEFTVIQRHPTLGGRALEKLCRLDPEDVFLKVAHEIALHHHERWDGSGYPFSLSQEKIPLSARIVALADVYDALTSERPYKRAYSHEVTRGLIITQSRSHFDPIIVESFLAREVDFMRIREAHAEISGAVRASRIAPIVSRSEDNIGGNSSVQEQPAQPNLKVVAGSQP